jgi:hypothetical protein
MESWPGSTTAGLFCALPKSAPNTDLCLKKMPMQMPRLIAIFCLLSLAQGTQAQMERTMYQVFEVDSAQSIGLDLLGIYEVETWAGSSVLVETNIQIWHASPEILAYLIKNGRYDVAMDTLAPAEMRIFTKNRERKPVKTPDGECTEIATAKIFVPDHFILSEDKKRLARKPE